MASTNSLDVGTKDPFIASNTDCDQRAIELVRKAIDEDTQHNYSEALKYYQNSLDYFMIALKYEKNEVSRTLIRSKINEYLSRAERLKDFLMTQKLTNPGVVNTASSSGGTCGTSNQDGAGGEDSTELKRSTLTKERLEAEQEDAACRDGAGDDAVHFDGAGEDGIAHSDGAERKELVADLDEAGGANETEAARPLIVKTLPTVTGAPGGSALLGNTNSPHEFSCKRPFWKRILKPSH